MPVSADGSPARLLACLLGLAGAGSTAAEEAAPDEAFLLYLAAWDDAMQLALTEAAQARRDAGLTAPDRRAEDEEDDED